MFKLTIIGLGIDEGDITKNALEIIKGAEKVVVRTFHTFSFNAIKNLNKKVISLDSVYEKSRNFNTLNVNLAKEVLKLLKNENVVYVVDGSATEDNSCKELLKRCKDCKIISGVSAKDKCLERLKISTTNVSSLSAYDVLGGEKFTLPAVIYAVDSKNLASLVKLKLFDLVGEEVDVFVASNDFTKKIKTYEIDRLPSYDYSTSIYIPYIELTKKQRFDYSDLLEILRILRSEKGCMWDREQTPKSIEKNLLEETYELLDAIEKDDDEQIIEEAGDVLLQVAFYSIFGEEECRYNSGDIISGICSKLITRHTHVFGEDIARSQEEALSSWNKNKAIEKGYQSGYDYIDSIPKNLPALMRAEKVGSRAKKYNFDFNNVEETYAKILEELEEIKIAVKNGNKEEIESECGDLLFSAVNTVRKLGVDAETALNRSTNKFILRFKRLEEFLIKNSKNMKEMTIEELDKYYDLLKKENVDAN